MVWAHSSLFPEIMMKLSSLKVTVKNGQFKRLSLQETSERLARQMYLEAICYPGKMENLDKARVWVMWFLVSENPPNIMLPRLHEFVLSSFTAWPSVVQSFGFIN